MENKYILKTADEETLFHNLSPYIGKAGYAFKWKYDKEKNETTVTIIPEKSLMKMAKDRIEEFMKNENKTIQNP